MLFTPALPAYTRDVPPGTNEQSKLTTANCDVARFWPAESRSEVIASGYDRLMDIAVNRTGSLVFAEYGTGSVHASNGNESSQLATNLDKPSGIAIDSDDNIYVSERGSGVITRITNGKTDTFVDGLDTPQGISVSGDTLYIVDTGSKSLLAIDISSGKRQTLASSLPVGAPTGITPKPLMSVGNLSGPMTDFTGLTQGVDGTLYISGDAEGSVLALKPNQ